LDGAVLELCLKIPILKQITTIVIKVIAEIAGVNFTTGKEILKQILFAILTIIISLNFPQLGLTSGLISGTTIGLTAGISTALTYSSYAMQIFSAFQQGRYIGEMNEVARERADRNYQRNKAREADYKVKEAFFGTMGTIDEHEARNYMMYDLMFNPFDFHPQAIPPHEINSAMNKF